MKEAKIIQKVETKCEIGSINWDKFFRQNIVTVKIVSLLGFGAVLLNDSLLIYLFVNHVVAFIWCMLSLVRPT